MGQKFCHLHEWKELSGCKYPIRLFMKKKYYFKKKSKTFVSIDGEKLSHAIWNYNYPDSLILRGEVIHHRNEDSLDDRIENYMKLTREKHNTLHNEGKRHSEIMKKKISLSNMGNKSRLGQLHSIDTKDKISAKNRGEGNGASKLTEEMVLEIRKSCHLVKEIAREYNVSMGLISDIRNRKAWVHL